MEIRKEWEIKETLHRRRETPRWSKNVSVLVGCWKTDDESVFKNGCTKCLKSVVTILSNQYVQLYEQNQRRVSKKWKPARFCRCPTSGLQAIAGSAWMQEKATIARWGSGTSSVPGSNRKYNNA
jgi:hypothetical protein